MATFSPARQPGTAGSRRPAGPTLTGRLLVVDDDDAVRACVARIAASVGCSADTAGGVDDALVRLAGGGYDVALVDLDMPERSGLDLLTALPALGTDVVPVLLTGTTDVAVAVRAMKLGAYDYLPKPVDPAALTRVVGRAIDVARARRREEALRRVVAEWASTFDACPDLLVVLGPDGRVLRANEAAAARAGPAGDDVAGRSVEELYPGGLGAAAVDRWRRQLAGEPAASVRLFDALLGGHFLVTVTPLGSSAGPSPGAVLVARDVTDLVRAKLDLAAREAHTRAVLATAADAIVTYDDHFRVEALNPACEAAFGYPAAAAVGLDVRRLLDFAGDERRPPAAPADAPPEGPGGGRVRRWATTGRRRDGATFPAEVAVGEVSLAGGRKFVGVVRDLTEWKRGEEVRARLFRQILSAQEDERRRISRDLHDGIGQTLVSLVMGLESVPAAAADGATVDRLRHLAGVAAESLREVRRLAQGLRPTVLDDLGLPAALARLVDLFNGVHSVRADLVAADDLPDRYPTEVESAAYRIVQEALANVVKHAHALTVDVVLEATDDGLRLTVADDGTGFDAPDRPAAGGGLGLSGMRERAALLGGTFRVDSAPGRGTTIDVRLPATKGAP